ncbi:hypothetical protein KQI84_14350 [bacterium]|nr:hypothetical protein [bacterium]
MMSRIDAEVRQSNATESDAQLPVEGLGPEIPTWTALDDSVFEIRGYDRVPPFSSFLPGIGGLHGAPLWAMYVNRGQAVCSFGYEDKDHAIGEFFSATWAYQLTSLYGFRTFLIEGDGNCFEPFADHCVNGRSGVRTMRIQPHAVTLIDENETAGWRMQVDYCAVTDSPVPALCRRVRITNLRPHRRSVRLADGLPLIIPAGVSDFSLKRLRRITEGFIRVSPHKAGGAVYLVPTSMKDEAKVEATQEAVFYGAWLQEDGNPTALELAVDPDAFFSPGSNLLQPDCFVDGTFCPDDQAWMNRLPCAMAMAELDFAPEQTIEFVAYAGLAPNTRMLDEFVASYSRPEFQHQVESKAQALVQDITRPAYARTASKELNGYLRQNFLDNLLRGGIPHLFPSSNGARPVHIYTRRHGDLERDYNDFKVPAHPYSEGAGNFRDILQNRRHDPWFYPESGALEILAFAELIQADGYNPLSVEGYRWQLPDEATARELCPLEERKARDEFVHLTTHPFSPGELLQWRAKHDSSAIDADSWLRNVLTKANAMLSAKPDEDGYWVDHWIYLADMLEAHNAMFPDTHAELLQANVGWFEPRRRVLSRSRRYQAVDGKARQYGALGPRQAGDRTQPWPEVSLASKLVMLAVLKGMTLDPEGRGVEMEAGRPGWNDSLNGLPGVFGSCLSETSSIIRLCDYLLAHREEWGQLEMPSPAAALMRGALPIASAESYDWNAAAELRENFREEVYVQWPIDMQAFDAEEAAKLLEAVREMCRRGVEAARVDNSPLVYTYFMRDGEVDQSDTIDPRPFKAEPLPLYLEGQVYRLRNAKTQEEAREFYSALRKSPLYDRKLHSYMLNMDLTNCTDEIGRARTFSRGIYENESIWLHMSYKILVELVRHGLHEEFFEAARTMLVPFMDPERYGRSIYENSSYIVSSSCPDKRIHGRGFVARLSGSTAEFIHLWLLLSVGAKPFVMNDGELEFRLTPALPAEWFAEEPGHVAWDGEVESLPANSLTCALFGKTLLVYQNDSLLNTFGDDGAKIVGYVVDGERHDGDVLRGSIARAIRDGEVRRLDVLLK